VSQAKKWSDIFRRSRLGPAIFVVAADSRGTVHDWVHEQDVPSFQSSGMYESTVNAWAVLDAGITSIFPYGWTSLPLGVRVIGWQTLRLLIDQLSLVPPRGPLIGETEVLEPAELLRRHLASSETDTQAIERADILVSCTDGPSLQWATRTLIGDAGLPTRRESRSPAAGIWGDLRFTAEAAEMLTGKIDPDQAYEIAQWVTWTPSIDGEMGSKLEAFIRGLGNTRETAQLVLDVQRIGPALFKKWMAAGFAQGIIVEAIDRAIDLPTAIQWSKLGATGYELLGAVEAGLSPAELEAYRSLGIPFDLSTELAKQGITIQELENQLAKVPDPEQAARSLAFPDPS
jgi:hypothetical protein